MFPTRRPLRERIGRGRCVTRLRRTLTRAKVSAVVLCGVAHTHSCFVTLTDNQPIKTVRTSAPPRLKGCRHRKVPAPKEALKLVLDEAPSMKADKGQDKRVQGVPVRMRCRSGSLAKSREAAITGENCNQNA